mgnify:CR=1 FL=1
MELYIGYLAGTMGTICWIPQAWRAWSTRDTSGLSLAANLMFLRTAALGLIYGLMVGNMPLFMANFWALLIVVSIVLAKLKYK